MEDMWENVDIRTLAYVYKEVNCHILQAVACMKLLQDTSLVVDDGLLSSCLRQRNRRNTSNELSEFLADFEPTVTSDGPQQRVDQ